MRLTWTRSRYFLQLCILIIAAYLASQLIITSRENQQLRADKAEINHIKYNLLNVEAWSSQLQDILKKKIDDFTITSENEGTLRNSIQKILYRLIDEVEVLMEERTAGQFSRFKRWVAEMAVDVDQLRDSVPAYSEQIIDELNKPETRSSIKDLLTQKVDQYVTATNTGVDIGGMKSILAKYDCTTREEGSGVIGAKLEQNMAAIQARMLLVITSVLLVFLLGFTSGREAGLKDVTILLLGSLSLLVCGISLPMIQLEAKIDMVRFELLGEEMLFRDNILYYQSKSILEMVRILMQEGSFRMIVVGLLIFTFSLIFPVLKSLGTLAYSTGNPKIRQNRLVSFFALYSGKWSMADVMVVAIFMAYIGFNGIVDNNLESFAREAEPVEVFTTNGTQLLSGFFLFLSFVLSGLILSEFVKRKVPLSE